MITSPSGALASRLGLAAHPQQHARDCIRRAFANGINYFFFYGAGHTSFVHELKKLSGSHRDEIIIATGSGARKRNGLQAVRRRLTTAVHTEFLDVFFAEYIHPGDDLATIFAAGGVLDQLQEWKTRGWIRLAGASVHDRDLAERLARDQRVDVLMHRFNMAHRKAADRVFPVALQHQTPIVAFTATRWGTLLQPHPSWPHASPTAADCYRYCLTHPAVRLVLTSPRTGAELDENLGVLAAKSMTRRELARWEQFGDLVYGNGAERFETQWP
jgi:aryl-alcohol dehydrogenase-like predicted oxidoreductase